MKQIKESKISQPFNFDWNTQTVSCKAHTKQDNTCPDCRSWVIATISSQKKK